MTELAQRCETATGPDRVIDWEIHCRNGLDGVGYYGDHPAYTGSIDAALTLVPDKLRKFMFLQTSEPAKAGFEHDGHFVYFEAATAALALCAAALRASHAGPERKVP